MKKGQRRRLDGNNPAREALEAITGETPPSFVRGYTFDNLTDEETEELQDWAASHARPSWSTGIGILEAAEHMIAEAISNTNLRPPEGEPLPKSLLDRKPPPKRRWHVAIPIAGALYFEMESETEPTFEKAVDYCANYPKSVPPEGDLCWEWHDTLHGEGNVSRSFDHADVFEVTEVKEEKSHDPQ